MVTILSSNVVGFSSGCLSRAPAAASEQKKTSLLLLLRALPLLGDVSRKTSPRSRSKSKNRMNFSVLRCCSPQVQELEGDDVLQTFLKERRLTGDLVSKASDLLWIKDYLNIIDSEASMLHETPQLLQEVMESENDSGLLKLTKAYDWVLGDKIAPINKKATAKELQNDSDRRKRLNMLRYDAIKREMLLLTIGVGTVCSGFCLIALSFQAAISYALGVILSCLYLQLLYEQVDKLSRENVPQIFRQKKKSNKIGIRSEDVTGTLEKVVRGSGFVLSSPRLLFPAIIYGFWGFSNNYLSNEFLSFQLVPAMFGLFAYKAAALVQVYRDNEDLLIVFPESWEGSSNN